MVESLTTTYNATSIQATDRTTKLVAPQQTRLNRSRTSVTTIAERGKWFASVNYWLFPSELEEQTLKRLSQFKRPPRPDFTVYSAADFSKPIRLGTATAEECKKYEEAIRSLKVEIYNSQPLWQLCNLNVRSNADFTESVAEFLDMTGKTAQKFDWLNREFSTGMRWREHGWKHVCYAEISHFWELYRTGFLASSKIEILDGSHDVEALFVAAAEGNPESVARIWSWFPTVQQMQSALVHVFGPDGGPNHIVEPAEIAAKLVRIIYEQPESEEAETSRKILNRLISPSVTKGEKGGRGRPRTRIPPSILRCLGKMSYCQVQQVRGVFKFLQTRSRSADLTALDIFYPWISGSVGEAILNFIRLDPHKAVLLMVSRLTGVSQGALEKMGLRFQK